MSVSYEQAEKIKKFLLKNLGITHAGIGLSKVKMYDKKPPEGMGEDWCVAISFYETVPAGVKIPKEKNGVRIFVSENRGTPEARGKPMP